MKNIIFSTELMFAKATSGVNMESQHEILNAMSELLDSGAVKTTLKTSSPWGLQEMIEAQQLIESGKSVGKVVLSREM